MHAEACIPHACMQALSSKLQAELNIDTQKKQAWLTDLMNARKNGTLAPK